MRHYPSQVKALGLLLFTIFLTLLSSGPVHGVPAAGARFPEIRLPVPDDRADKEYLGLSGSGSFGIGSIWASVVVVEFFSMYCPHCQADAPTTVALFERIGKDPILSKKVKMLGIGIGNSDYEVGVFKKKYRIPFPLFSDGELEIQDLLDIRFTPTYIVVKVDKGRAIVVSTHVGRIDDLDEFFKRLSSVK